MAEFKGIITKLGLRAVTIRLDDEKDYKALRIGKCTIKQEAIAVKMCGDNDKEEKEEIKEEEPIPA